MRLLDLEDPVENQGNSRKTHRKIVLILPKIYDIHSDPFSPKRLSAQLTGIPGRPGKPAIPGGPYKRNIYMV